MADSQRSGSLAAIPCSLLDIALASIQLQRATARQLAECQRLQQATAALLRRLSLEQVLETICSESQYLTDAPGGSIFLVEDDGWLSLAFSTGAVPMPTIGIPARGSSGMERLFALPALRAGEPICDNAPASEAWGYAADARLTAILAVPLVLRANAIGLLHLVNKPGGFSEQDARLIRLFADQAPVAIENARLSQQVEQIAILEERQRLARELHDSVTQSLYSATLYVEAAIRNLQHNNPSAAAEHLHDLRYTAREALHEMRLLIFELRPPILEHEGLVAALQARLDSVEQRSGLQTELHAEVGQQFPPAIAEELYRIAQEALNNVVKHAQAQRVTLHLHSTDVVVLEVQDDGIGFDPSAVAEQSGMGIRGMRERIVRIGGNLSITSVPGSGTRIRAEVGMR